MRVWSVQPIEVYNKFIKDGYLICDPALSENIAEPCFLQAYNWLVKQMEEKIGKRPEGVTYPIWAWHTREWKHKKPDLRLSGYMARGEKAVLLELEIPDNEIVLSDFDAWHFVLNRWYLSGALNEEDCDRDEAMFETLPSAEKEQTLHKSWKRVFDTTPFNNDWTCRGRYIQATFWVLKSEYVKKVQFFTAK